MQKQNPMHRVLRVGQDTHEYWSCGWKAHRADCRTHIVGACQAAGNNTPIRCPSTQAEAGKVVMAGAFGETPEGALFIFKDATPEVR